MVLTGSCMCAEPAVKAVCHCLNCQKFSGSAFTTNFIIPRSAFKVVFGSPKSGEYLADSGYKYHTFFCGDCGSSLYGQPESLPEMMSIKAGSLDPEQARLADGNIDAEAFVKRRVTYLKPIDGASQVEGMIQA
ncbi:Mss4-like protein [Aspergillus pseudonomiae]|uniref:Mss4-like protein n=1 Tax=Aspergillus pseudonomiae TaxID=1506151 RepID=A0A5N7DWC4_9EURO|nr:Mss4-like protein [Aspergillus pseudonomiae]KAE8409808.1 Mss4-like protein [Aspergillus pseudonomiae]